LLLQDIDANFSKMQQVLSNRILPAFKRYSIGTEPAREAAKVYAYIHRRYSAHDNSSPQFWTSFYEQAAQVRIPTYDDLSSLQETSSGTAMEEPRASSCPEDLSVASGFNADTFNPNRTPSETSFVPAQAAVSSTPAATVARTRGANDASTPLPPGTDPSWGMSLESPLVRLDRELREFARADPLPASTSASSDLFSEADLTVGNIATVAAEEMVHAAPTPASAPVSSNARVVRPTVQTHDVPPLSFRRNPVTSARNPYIPAHSDPHNWSGIVDLRSTQPPALSFSAVSTAGTEKDDEPTLPAGMSPPVMVPFATLPSLGRSPVRAAAENIRRALVRDALCDGGGDSIVSANATGSGSGSMVPTPPSLTRYTRGTSASQNSSSSLRPPDLGLDSMIRRVQDPSQPHWWRSSAGSSTSSTSIPDKSLSTPPYYTTPAPSTHAYAHDAAFALPEMSLPTPSGVTLPVPGGDAETTIDAMPESDDASASTSTFSSSGEDSVHNTAHPSAAFLLASRQRGMHDYDDDEDEDDELDHDDDFDDSLDAAGDAGVGVVPVHPFARVRASVHGEYEDDSFDSLESGEEEEMPEETVFGLRPAERNEAARLQPQLRMYGEELLQDTMGIGTRLARAGRIEESPTPWGTGGGGRTE
jgi:DASH complex subunit ASK1